MQGANTAIPTITPHRTSELVLIKRAIKPAIEKSTKWDIVSYYLVSMKELIKKWIWESEKKIILVNIKVK